MHGTSVCLVPDLHLHVYLMYVCFQVPVVTNIDEVTLWKQTLFFSAAQKNAADWCSVFEERWGGGLFLRA